MNKLRSLDCGHNGRYSEHSLRADYDIAVSVFYTVTLLPTDWSLYKKTSIEVGFAEKVSFCISSEFTNLLTMVILEVEANFTALFVFPAIRILFRHIILKVLLQRNHGYL